MNSELLRLAAMLCEHAVKKPQRVVFHSDIGKEDEKKMIYAQGDVLLRPIEGKVDCNEKGTAVLALGEVSGHSHRMSGVSFVKGSDGLATQILVPPMGAELVHEEHETIQIPQGRYEVLIQREYDVVEGTRQVMD